MATGDLVSVLIVNYNGRRYLDACLGALAAQDLPRHRFEVIVADNASTDGSVEHLRRRHPWVHTVALARNGGFTGGNLAALAVARSGKTRAADFNDMVQGLMNAGVAVVGSVLNEVPVRKRKNAK